MLFAVVSYILQQQTQQFHSLAAAQFALKTVTASAESVDGSTPAVRVTWSTTIPPECVASVRVDFRTSSHGPPVATNTTTNTSVTEVIQTGLQCATNYYITVVVTGATSDGIQVTWSSRPVQIFTGEIYHDIPCNHNNVTVCHLHRYTTAVRTESCSHSRQHKYQCVMAVVTSGSICVC